MAFSTEFLELMPSTVSYSTLVGFDNYGDPDYSTTSHSVRALINQNPTVVRNTLGEEVVSMYTVYAASTTELPVTAQYSLPNGDQPSVQNITIYYDEDGVHHNVLFLGGGQGG